MPTSVHNELKKSTLNRPQIIRISLDAFAALNYLHIWKNHPILHRDICRLNVLEPSSTG